MNEQASKEWLIKSWHNLSTAQLLFDVNHYTDIIAIDLHYSCEKTLKSILAYQNKKILKSHDLVEIYKSTLDFIAIEEIELLKQISEYHIEESYPAFDRPLPPREEIKEVLEFTEYLFDKVCNLLEIDKSEVVK